MDPLKAFVKMFTSLRKIQKDKGVDPTEFEESVAQAIFDLETTNKELNADLKDLFINSAVQFDISNNKKVVVIHVHYRLRKSFRKIHSRLVRELEKKFSGKVKPLIWIEAQVEKYSKSRVEIMIKAKSQFKDRSYANNVEIDLPIPPDATNPKIWTSMGTATYKPENDAIQWKIKSFPGNKEYLLRAEFTLTSISSDDRISERKAPVRVRFEIPYFTISGIQDKFRYTCIVAVDGIWIAANCVVQSVVDEGISPLFC